MKLMQAMAMGRAIVATSLGAEGFPFESGRHLLLADGAAEFAVAVASLLDDPQRRAQLGADARAFVQAYYGWDRLVPRLEALYHTDR